MEATDIALKIMDAVNYQFLPLPEMTFQSVPTLVIDKPEPASDDDENDNDDAESDSDDDIEDCLNATLCFKDFELQKVIRITPDRCIADVEHVISKNRYVIIVSKNRHPRQSFEGIPREVVLLTIGGDHPNIAQLLGWAPITTDIYAMLFPHYVNVCHVIGTFQSDYMIATYMNGLLQGLLHLKHCKVAHRDISTYNLMWNPASKQLVIIDFDLACRSRKEGYRNCFGREEYSSPEKLKGHYTDHGDVYSAGVVFWMLLKHEKHSPKREDLERWMHNKIKQRRDKKFPQIDLLHKMLQRDPHRRITLEAALEHRFFKECISMDPITHEVMDILQAEQQMNDGNEEKEKGEEGEDDGGGEGDDLLGQPHLTIIEDATITENSPAAFPVEDAPDQKEDDL